MTAVVTSHHNAAGLLRIYINEKLHLAFSTAKLAGIQSWTLSHTRTPPTYTIEITPAEGKRVVAEYDDEAVWLGVLQAIDKSFGSTNSRRFPPALALTADEHLDRCDTPASTDETSTEHDAVAAEREECAQVAERVGRSTNYYGIARAIRSRASTPAAIDGVAPGGRDGTER